MKRFVQPAVWACALLLITCFSHIGLAQDDRTEVTGQVIMEGRHPDNRSQELATVVWLTPLDVPGGVARPEPKKDVQLVQKGKQFIPHLLVIPVGTAVEFPNRDPFFHNVFSLFNGKRFDLGLYEAGSSRTVHFDRPGISYIFCNIHSEMSAVIIAVETPYFAVAGSGGSLRIPNVRPGRYKLNVWHEGSSPEALASLSRNLEVSAGSSSLGTLLVPQDEAALGHKNKYGKEYEEPASPGYEQK